MNTMNGKYSVAKSLMVKAKDNYGHTYPVSLRMEPLGWVLRIEGTPGSWYMDDLKGSREIAIDLGQNWICTNLDEIMAEAVSTLGET
jgi:hypothetical protein